VVIDKDLNGKVTQLKGGLLVNYVSICELKLLICVLWYCRLGHECALTCDFLSIVSTALTILCDPGKPHWLTTSFFSFLKSFFFS